MVSLSEEDYLSSTLLLFLYRNYLWRNFRDELDLLQAELRELYLTSLAVHSDYTKPKTQWEWLYFISLSWVRLSYNPYFYESNVEEEYPFSQKPAYRATLSASREEMFNTSKLINFP